MREIVVVAADSGRRDIGRNDLHSLRLLLLLLVLLLLLLLSLIDLQLLALLCLRQIIDVESLRAVDLLLLLGRLHKRLVVRKRAALLARQVQVRAKRRPGGSVGVHLTLSVRYGATRQHCQRDDRGEDFVSHQCDLGHVVMRRNTP